MSTPCPSGWGFDPKDTVALGKLAVDAGLVVLYEIEGGQFRLTGRSKTLAKSGRKASVADCVATQSRFRGMDDATAGAVQAWVDERWERFVARDAGACDPVR
jgi:pyruvate ferredoxin oxidoreductase beta subunit